MEDEGMVKMFKALDSSGLREFLGCSSAIYEVDLVSFCQNALVKNNTVISSVQGKYVEISEEHFAGAFELPTEGLTDMNEGTPDLDLGKSKAFPPLKILMDKNVGTYIAKNKNITADEETADPPVEKVFKKAAAKRRPAPAVAEPAKKKKRTTVGRAAPKKKNPAIVQVVIAETAEIEMEETETVEPVVMETTVMEPVETESRIDAEKENEKEKEKKEKETKKETADTRKRDEKVNDSEDTEPLSKVLELTETSLSDEESMSIDDILRQIPEGMMLPSVLAEELTKI
ncbi:hypothetical protein F511_40823 [Dorcoceras hygrometricum]|uniref:Uncharacterized protein n=1 Tax=Dorcoceras hygrometricum TaxID=472368 RepID=A0A2Z7A0B4_9LAMI|nr:hypothetical protein F511_40823 [Dorcoceras hygrometricum]